MVFACCTDKDVFNDIQGPPNSIHGAFGKTGRSGSVAEVKYVILFLIDAGRFKIGLSGQKLFVVNKALRGLIPWPDDENILRFDIGEVFKMNVREEFHTIKRAVESELLMTYSNSEETSLKLIGTEIMLARAKP